MELTAFFARWSLPLWILIYICFTTFENSQFGFQLIKKYFPFYNIYKNTPNTIKTNIGDFLAAMIGWICAYLIASFLKPRERYPKQNRVES